MLQAIAVQFAKDQPITDITPLGNGLINDTFLARTASFSFVLQRINQRVFPEPEHIMANVMMLNQHIRQKNADTVKLQIPDVLTTQAGQSGYKDEDGEYWRALSLIEQTESFETLGGLDDARQAGFALGHFHALLCDLNPAAMYDTLPGFHITPDYLNRYQTLIPSLPKPVSPESRFCAGFIDRNQHMADDLEAAKRQGLLPLRVIHGDPKLNNFLFDKNSRKIVSVIDLDTVKPGLIHYDIGDCLRSCCHRMETDTFDLEICEAILDSYLGEAGVFFSEPDYHYLYPAIRLIPFELGLRFYTDYLEGDRYFKVTEPKQNLQRAAEQFRLCESILSQAPAIKNLIMALKARRVEG